MPEPTDPTEPTAAMPTGDAGGETGGDAVVGGRYVLRDVVGRGGMGTVWRAHDPVLARDVAVKTFTHAAAAGHDAAARATAEVRLLAGLSHPNLVAVYDALGDEPDRFDHLVMELVPGRSLRDRLDEGPLPPQQVARLGAELAAGLEYVHSRGIVHRDLKPANVLLEATGHDDRAKIVDFGVARLLEGTALTMAGHTVGTANYLSPEQATGEQVGPPSDVYSLGLMLIECLTGVMAYPGHGVAAASARLHRQPVVPAVADPRWHELLTAMTARDPAARPGAGEIAARCAELARAAGDATAIIATDRDRTTVLPAAVPVGAGGGTAVLPAGGPVPLVPAQDDRRRRRLVPALLFGVLGVAALAVILGVAVGGGDDGTAAPSTPPSTSAPATTSPAPTGAASSTGAAARSSSAAKATSSKATSSKATSSKAKSSKAKASTKTKQQPPAGPGGGRGGGPGGGGPGGGPGDKKGP